MNIHNKALLEGFKEIIRTALIAVLPLMINDLQTDIFHYRTWIIAGAIAVLSGIDKWLHQKNTGIAGNGLTGV